MLPAATLSYVLCCECHLTGSSLGSLGHNALLSLSGKVDVRWHDHVSESNIPYLDCKSLCPVRVAGQRRRYLESWLFAVTHTPRALLLREEESTSERLDSAMKQMLS